jgi:hypothetical protein
MRQEQSAMRAGNDPALLPESIFVYQKSSSCGETCCFGEALRVGFFL